MDLEMDETGDDWINLGGGWFSAGPSLRSVADHAGDILFPSARPRFEFTHNHSTSRCETHSCSRLLGMASHRSPGTRSESRRTEHAGSGQTNGNAAAPC